MSLSRLLQEYKVEIPIIQRDYAQGRSGYEELRREFLTALRVALSGVPIQLDFIYGSVAGNTVHLLDGQQRITTLFLLTWYLAQKEGRLVESDVQAKLTKFTYETRTSSREFCQKLVNRARLDPTMCIRLAIEDQGWFQPSWNNDPTVQSMLQMLKSIQIEFQSSSFVFDSLWSDASSVSFYFLPLEGIGQPEDLYITMNARGRPLSDFECFKAKMEKHLRTKPWGMKPATLNSRTVSTVEMFSHKIDTEWADFFWGVSGRSHKLFDRVVQGFFYTLLAGRAAQLSQEPLVRGLVGTNDEKSPTFEALCAASCMDEQFFHDLTIYLDSKQSALHAFEERCSSLEFCEPEVLARILRGEAKDAAYAERLQIHARVQFLVRCEAQRLPLQPNSLVRWTRVIHNLVIATGPFNDEHRFALALRAIDKLAVGCHDILQTIMEVDPPVGIDEVQYQEEQLKASVIIAHPTWESRMVPCERHPYFDGQIGFLLDLSGIKKYFDTYHHCLWTSDEDAQFEISFNALSSVAQSAFGPDGLNEFDDYRFRRALLTKGDFRLSISRNQSLLCNSHRDVSWKRFLKGDRESKHRGLIGDFFYELSGSTDFEGELISIINRGPVPSDWRRYFIEVPELFSYMKQSLMCMRETDTQGLVLLSGERMNGAHVELSTFAFFKRNRLGDMNWVPFNRCFYRQSDGEAAESRPCICWESVPLGETNVELTMTANAHLGSFLISLVVRSEHEIGAVILPGFEQLGYSLASDRLTIGCDEKHALQIIQDTVALLSLENVG